LAGKPEVFTIPDDVVRHMQRNMASKQVCAVDSLIGLRCSSDGGLRSFRFDREAEAWTDTNGEVVPTSRQEALHAAAQLLRDLRAVAVADLWQESPVDYGLEEPALTIEIEQPAVSGKRLLIGAATPDGGRYIRGPATGYVHIIGPEAAAALMALWADRHAASGGDGGQSR
jgi:hypothetical protein